VYIKHHMGGNELKKLLLVLILLLFIAVVGCSKDNNETNNDDNQNEPDTTEVDDESETEDDPVEEPSESDDPSTPQESPDSSTEEEEPVEKEEPVTPKYEISEAWSVVPLEEGVNENVVLLTIDDAPDKNAVDMAKTLKALDAPAIFFVNGHFIDTEEEQARLKEIHEMGFAIGNHTFNHTKLDDVSEEEQREEIVKLNDLIEEVIGERPKYFRAPHGVNTDFVVQLAKEEGMVLMNWTYGYDYFKPYMDAEKLTTAMVTGEGPEVGVPYSLLKSGANLLMHDRDWTAAALEDIVVGLREQGYETVDPALIKLPE
jgi:peptidoglycan/xylan/chitin deacetylase (PgdA/CDA1 family)